MSRTLITRQRGVQQTLTIHGCYTCYIIAVIYDINYASFMIILLMIWLAIKQKVKSNWIYKFR